VVQPPAPTTKRWWIAGGLTAVAGAIIAVVALRGGGEPDAPSPLPIAVTQPPTAVEKAQPVEKIEQTIEPKPEPKPVEKPAVKAPVRATGRLTVGCKSVPCTVSINGGPAIRSPIRGLELAVGKHQVAIVNRELGIDDRFAVEVRAGSNQAILKEYEKPAPTPQPEPPRPEEPKRDKTINPFAKQPGK
jgi:hypothetical protein